jgi:hypothetical protein
MSLYQWTPKGILDACRMTKPHLARSSATRIFIVSIIMKVTRSNQFRFIYARATERLTARFV